MSLKSKKVFVVFSLFTTLIMHASTYDTYSLQTNDTNITQEKSSPMFMDGEFDEIIRFNEITFSSNSFDNDGKNNLDTIVATIKDAKQESKKVLVSIIGHASQNIQDTNEAIENTKENTSKIEKYLLDSGVDASTLFIEHRGIKDQLYTTTTTKGRDLSSRVMVVLYINLPRDLDGDGIDRDQDKCPNTVKGTKVGKNGCKLKTMVVLLSGKKELSSIVVGTRAGTVVVDKVNQLVSIQSQDAEPSQPVDLSQEDLESLMENTLDGSNREEISYVLYFKALNLVGDSIAKAKEMLERIAQRKSAYIKIIGHTDTMGSNERNDIVSANRANVISKMIQDANIPYLKIDKEAYSESNLAIETADEVSEPFNRRVEVFIN
ncbi:OmpA family protein [Sulfurimonas sp.]|nr:OmpA family protein [Sulfurimonas sp.]